MKIKVCGMKFRENILDIAALKPDYMGFIFHDRSPRFVGSTAADDLKIPSSIIKTGVFVNPDFITVANAITEYELQAVQLHGNESSSFCEQVRSLGVTVIKAFGIGQGFSWETLKPYSPVMDFFLFDTRSNQHGGTGRTFDWQLLKGYTGGTPYFLSGGLSLENLKSLELHADSRLYGLDLNSKFEDYPGFKNKHSLHEYFDQINKMIIT